MNKIQIQAVVKYKIPPQCSVAGCEMKEATALAVKSDPQLYACPEHKADFWIWKGGAFRNAYHLKTRINFEVVLVDE